MQMFLSVAFFVAVAGLTVWFLLRESPLHRRERIRTELGGLDEQIARAIVRGKNSEARQLAEQAAATAEKELGQDTVTVLLLLRAGFLASVERDDDTATAHRDKALAMARRFPAPAKPALAEALMDVAGGHRVDGNLEASAAYWDEAVEVWEEIGASDDKLVRCHEQLSQIRDELGDPDGSDQHLRAAYELARELPDPPPFVLSNYAHRQLARGRLDEARAVCDQLMAEARAAKKDLASLRALSADIYVAAGDSERAEAVAREQLAKAGSGDRIYSQRLLARVLRGVHKWDEALEVADDLLAGAVDKHGENDPATVAARTERTLALKGLGRTSEARAAASQNVDVLEAAIADSERNSHLASSLEEARELLASLPD